MSDQFATSVPRVHAGWVRHGKVGKVLEFFFSSKGLKKSFEMYLIFFKVLEKSWKMLCCQKSNKTSLFSNRLR
jgi:hypothetical protein